MQLTEYEESIMNIWENEIDSIIGSLWPAASVNILFADKQEKHYFPAWIHIDDTSRQYGNNIEWIRPSASIPIIVS